MCSADARGRDGFTLVEILVAMVITAILATVVFQLIQGQGRFVQMESSREEVQQNTRGALELIASELRSIPAGAIDTAASSRIRFRLPRAWGVLCDNVNPTSGTAGIAFPAGTFPTDFPSDLASAADWGIAVPTSASGGYTAATITAVSTGMGNCTANIGLQAGTGAAVRQFTYQLPSGTPAATAGSAVFLFQRVEYDAAASSSGSPPGIWLRRGTVASSPQPMAGPLLATDTLTSTTGLSFTYYCGTQLLTAAQVAARANWLSIDRIRVRVAMQSRNKLKGVREVQRDSITVHLRNNPGGVACPL